MRLWPFQIKDSVRHQKPVCSKTKVSLQRLQTQNCVTVSWASWSRLPPIAKSMTCSRIQSVEEQGDPEPCLFYFVVIIFWEIPSYIRFFCFLRRGSEKAHTDFIDVRVLTEVSYVHCADRATPLFSSPQSFCKKCNQWLCLCFQGSSQALWSTVKPRHTLATFLNQETSGGANFLVHF